MEEKVFIVKGLYNNEQNNKIEAIINENAVHKTIEMAQRELKITLNRIRNNLEDNDIRVEEELTTNNDFLIYTEYGEYYHFEIVERKIFE